MIKKKNKIEDNNIKHIESKETYITSDVKVEDRNIMVMNAIAPCDDTGRINFLTELSNAVYKNMNTYSEIVYLGDFNVATDKTLDIMSGNKHNQNMVEVFKNGIKMSERWRLLERTPSNRGKFHME